MPDALAGAKRPRRGRRRTIAFGLLAVGLGLSGGMLVFFTRAGVPTLPVPDPNGYDDLLQAARSIVGPRPMYQLPIVGPDPPMSSDTTEQEVWDQARAYVEANRAVLARARIGLGRDCVVPVSYRAGFRTQARANTLYELARLLRWEGRLAVRDRRIDDAARSFLDMVRLGHASARGGFETDCWGPGYRVETGGMRGLISIRGDLDPATCRQAIGVLRELDRRREPYRAFQARDAAYLDAVQGRLVTMRWELENYRTNAQQRASLVDNYDEFITAARLVQVELAIRAYEVERGREPDHLEALVPSYLPDLPLDLFSGRPPVYRRGKSGHVLYGIGPDRRDDGGAPIRRPGPWARPTGDNLSPAQQSSLWP